MVFPLMSGEGNKEDKRLLETHQKLAEKLLTGHGTSAMVTLMNEKSVRKPRNVWINPDALRKARIEALRAKKSLGQWLEEIIEEKAAREEREEIQLK